MCAHCRAMNARTSDYIAELTEKQARVEELEAQLVALNGKLLKRTTNMTDDDEQEVLCYCCTVLCWVVLYCAAHVQ
jgi:hypothetical protein